MSKKLTTNNRRSFGPFLFLAIFVGLVLLGRNWYFQPSLNPSEEAPTLTGTTPDGSTFDLNSQRGKFVYLNFWGSWCGPCLAKIPEIRQLATLPPGRFTLVNIAVEDAEARYHAARKRLDLPGVHLLDLSTSLRFLNGPVVRTFGVRELPTGFLIGPDGTIASYNPTAAEVRRLVANQQ